MKSTEALVLTDEHQGARNVKHTGGRQGVEVADKLRPHQILQTLTMPHAANLQNLSLGR